MEEAKEVFSLPVENVGKSWNNLQNKKYLKNFKKTLAKHSSLWYIKARSCEKHKR